MSPGLMPRPSLSEAQQERTAQPGWRVSPGVDAPAFVERSLSTRRGPGPLRVSPGLMPRPSLSERRHCRGAPPTDRVAGVDAPAFVERFSESTAWVDVPG